MRIKEIEVYQFNELSDKAKEKAREWWRSGSIGDDADYECLKEDLSAMLDIFGFDLGNAYYSGFSSQGDGASFTGKYTYKKGWRKVYLADYPTIGKDGKVEAWHKRNAEILGYLDAIAEANRKNFYDLVVTITHRGHYQHSGCMSVNVELNGEYRSRYADLIGDAESIITKNFRYIADDFYRELMEAYDWRNADEQVDESILMNEYEFDEDGGRV